MTDSPEMLGALAEHHVEYIIVGGAAATAHGAVRLTHLDIVYRRTRENIVRLAASLTTHQPYLRGAPPGLPFRWDAETVQRGLNFTLATDLGPLDVLGEIAGGGGYDALLPHSQALSLFGVECRCISLEQLIIVKRAAGRPKDLEALAELEAIAEERRNV